MKVVSIDFKLLYTTLGDVDRITVVLYFGKELGYLDCLFDDSKYVYNEGLFL